MAFPRKRLDETPGIAQTQRGIGLTGFFTALSVSLALFAFQILLFLLLRRKKRFQAVYGGERLAEKSNTSRKGLLQLLRRFLASPDDSIIETCGLDAYFFHRYLKAVLVIFKPIILIVMPVLLVLNYVDGKGQDYDARNGAHPSDTPELVIGLDTFAFGNIRDVNTRRYSVHAVMAGLVVIRFCLIALQELREYVRQRQMYFRRQTEGVGEASLVLVSPIPSAWQSREDFKSCFNLLPGGIKKIQIIPDMRRLIGMLGKRESLVARCEAIATAAVKLAVRARQRQDTDNASPGYGGEDPCWKNLRDLDAEIQQEKEKLKAGSAPIHSALVQFRCTLAAHMATGIVFEDDPFDECIVVRAVSADDVVLDKIGITRLGGWLRGTLVNVVLAVMIILWAIPIAATAALSQVDSLIQNHTWLSFIRQNSSLHSLVAAIAGVLPGAALSLLLYTLPNVLGLLARIRGAKLHSQTAAFVQRLYFIFLFIQVVLVVSIASFFTASLPQYLRNIKSLDSVGAVFSLLSRNLPSAANYFFSYMALQALGRSSGVVLQLQRLAWFVWDRVVDHTPMEKWNSQEKTDIIAWACDFPVYTTLACVGLLYSVIAPLISIFVVLSFGLMRLTHGYSVTHTTRPVVDHGGILYPTAIHQTFLGIYVMLVCLAGLFFGVHDQLGRPACIPHGVVMVFLLFAVAAYQAMLYSAFARHTESLPASDLEIERIAGMDEEKKSDKPVVESHPMLSLPLRAAWVPGEASEEAPLTPGMVMSYYFKPPGGANRATVYHAVVNGEVRVEIMPSNDLRVKADGATMP